MTEAVSISTGTHVNTAESAPACQRPLAPIGLLAELTYRCPLQCPYCSNPLAMERGGELSADEWRRVFKEAADLGVLQVHLSGGEPCARKDLEEILSGAVEAGLYTNLITSGVTLTRDRLAGLANRGLEHVQVSIQDTDPANADRISGYPGGLPKKLAVCQWVRELDLALTVNVVVHRHNIDNIASLIDFAVDVGAGRIEIANTQYYAWALKNRAALIPTREQFHRSLEVVRAAKERLKGILVFDVVVHDQYAVRPKPCMGGWGRSLIDITPTGKVLPCHACETIPNLGIETVRDRPLRDIWLDGPAFRKYRGTNWMKEPCKSCNRCEIDWGGCRCQALAVTGDAANADPACARSPWHEEFVSIAERESEAPSPPFIYRRMGATSPAQ